MKIKPIVIFAVALVFVYFVANIYANRIERIENGEMVQVSESYRDR